MNIATNGRLSSSRAFGLGLILLAPAAVFLLANILNEFGIGVFMRPLGALLSEAHRQRIFNVVSPVLFLGGIAVALLLNFLAIARVDLHWEQTRLVSTLTVEPRALNVALLVAACLALATLMAYAFAENYAIIHL